MITFGIILIFLGCIILVYGTIENNNIEMQHISILINSKSDITEQLFQLGMITLICGIIILIAGIIEIKSSSPNNKIKK